ncbi:transposase [Sorangium cellulosum]|nr:transposase [Sorangium cellulosum]
MRKTRTPGSATYLTRRRWTEDDAREALAKLAQSGLSLSAFAVREGLDPQRLGRWRRRLGPAAMPPFEEVPRDQVGAVLAGDGRTERFEVMLACGRVVRVPESFDASALRRLLEVVDEVGAC